MDHDRLRLALGVQDCEFSPIPELINRGKLHVLCEQAYSENKDKTEIHFIAGQYTKFLRSFNSVFTWPMLFSQQMPKSHHWARNFSRNEEQAKYVSKLINQ